MSGITYDYEDIRIEDYGVFTIYDEDGNFVDWVDTRREAEEYLAYHPTWYYTE